MAVTLLSSSPYLHYFDIVDNARELNRVRQLEPPLQFVLHVKNKYHYRGSTYVYLLTQFKREKLNVLASTHLAVRQLDLWWWPGLAAAADEKDAAEVGVHKDNHLVENLAADLDMDHSWVEVGRDNRLGAADRDCSVEHYHWTVCCTAVELAHYLELASLLQLQTKFLINFFALSLISPYHLLVVVSFPGFVPILTVRTKKFRSTKTERKITTETINLLESFYRGEIFII